MNEIFADTSFFIGLVDRADQHHDAVMQFLRGNRRPVFTTSAIILELGAFFSDVPLRASFLLANDAIGQSKLEIVHVTPALQRQGIELFGRRRDKGWSLTDCISFVVMDDRRVSEAATNDHHFVEAGFIALLRFPLTKS